MRTHRVKFICTSPECARFVAEEVLHVEFCDFTHWFCGLDGASEDTPDICIIYRGIMNPEVAYVEFDCNAIYGSDVSDDFILSKFDSMKAIRTGEKADHKVEKIEVEKLPCYKELLKAQEDLENVKKSINNAMTRKD